MARRIVLLRSRAEPIVWATLALSCAAISSSVWLNGLPFEGMRDAERDSPTSAAAFHLYAMLPIGLVVGFLAIRKAASPLGVVIRPEGLQIGYRTIVPWNGVSGLQINHRSINRSKEDGVIVITLNDAACAKSNIHRKQHEIDVKAHSSTTSWVLGAIVENAKEAGVVLPAVTET